jgi:hypothetical protein
MGQNDEVLRNNIHNCCFRLRLTKSDRECQRSANWLQFHAPDFSRSRQTIEIASTTPGRIIFVAQYVARGYLLLFERFR